VCQLRQGDLESGRQECELALRLDSRSPEGHFCMGVFYAQQGDADLARREFEVVMDTAPGMLAELARRQLDKLE
jgi:Tfp pilus assembly protein PilF